jgi:precorrin-6x reductase
MEQAMVLLIGGTSETAPLAAGLAGAGYAVLVSTATEAPLAIGDNPRIRRRSGRLDAEGLAGLCRKEGIRAIVDAAHPYAVAAHAAAAAAAARLGIPCLTFRRPTIFTADNGRSPHTGDAVIPGGETTPAPTVGYSSGPDRSPGCPTAATDVSDHGGDRMTLPVDVKDVTTPNRSKKPGSPRWPSGGAAPDTPSPPIRFAADHGEAARIAFADGRPVLLTTGSRNLAPYAAEAHRTGVPLAARVLDAPESLAACAAAGIPAERIIAARGPFSTAENLAAIGRFGIGVIVTKESGEAGGLEAKLAAAAAADCVVVLIRRPEIPAAGPIFADPAALVAALRRLVPPAP